MRAAMLRQLGIALWLSILLAACVQVPSAQTPTSAASVLAPSGHLRVGVYQGSPTSLVKNAQTGQSAGLAYELGHQLGQQLGVPVDVVEFSRVAEVIQALKSGQVDMTFTNATALRARDVDFTAALVQLELGLLVPPRTRIASFADADQEGIRIGVSLGSSSQGVLGQRLKHAKVVTAASLEVAAQMFKQGQIDAFATNKGILFEMAEKLPGYQVLSDRWGLENLAIAVPQGREAGREFLQSFAQQMQQQGQIKAMAQRAGLRGMAASTP